MNNSICPISFNSNQDNILRNECMSSNIINPYTGQSVSKSDADWLYKEELRFQTKMVEEQRQHEYRKEIENIKNENALKRDDAIAKRKYEREMATSGIIEDFEGALISNLIFPGGEEIVSQPILNVRHIKMKIIEAGDYKDYIQHITWNDGSDYIILSRNNMSPDGLSRQLAKKGVIFYVGRDRKKMIVEMLYAFLCKHADHMILPNKLGWNKMRDEWVFAFNINETMEGVICGKKYEK